MPAGNIYTTPSGLLDSRDLVADYYPRLEAAMEKLWITKLGKIVPSDRETEEYGWLGQVPVMRRWVGGRHEEVLKKYRHSVTNYKYEVTLPISVDDRRRDKSGQVEARIGELATRTATHWNKIAVPLIDTADAGTNGLAYDGQFFFDTDHNESGTNQSNDVTASEIPSANVSDPANPTPTECANIINEAIAYMQSLTDDQGEPINQDAGHVVIVVTKTGQAAGFRNAITLNNLNQSTDNPVNAAKTQGYTFEVIFAPARTTAANTVKLFMGEAGSVYSPIILQEELAPQTQIIAEGSTEEFWNDRHVFGVKAVRGVGYGLWQKSLMVTLS